MEVYARISTSSRVSSVTSLTDSHNTTAIPVAPMLRLCDDPAYSLRSRVFLSIVRFSVAMGPAFDFWTPPITAGELARAYERAASTMSHLMLSIVDHGDLERKRVKLPHGGWGWSYRAIDITAPAAACEGATA